MEIEHEVVMPIGFSFGPLQQQHCISVVSTSPCANDLCQSQSSPALRRAYFGAALAGSCEYSRKRQDSGSGGGIYKPKLCGTEESICCEPFLCIPWRDYTTAGLIHPRVNPWCSVFDRIKKCPGHISGRLHLLAQLEAMARAIRDQKKTGFQAAARLHLKACIRLKRSNQGISYNRGIFFCGDRSPSIDARQSLQVRPSPIPALVLHAFVDQDLFIEGVFAAGVPPAPGAHIPLAFFKIGSQFALRFIVMFPFQPAATGSKEQ